MWKLSISVIYTRSSHCRKINPLTIQSSTYNKDLRFGYDSDWLLPRILILPKTSNLEKENNEHTQNCAKQNGSLEIFVSFQPNSFSFWRCGPPCSSSASFKSGYRLQVSAVRRVEVIVVDSSNQISQMWEVANIELERQDLRILASSLVVSLPVYMQSSIFIQ